MQPTIALKVNVETYRGTRNGVPQLLALLDRFGIKATFYFAMGPDNSGKAIRRIVTRRGFLQKLLRCRSLALCGLSNPLYGTLIPAPYLADSLADVMRDTAARGHEVGIYGWDPVKWLDLLPWFTKPVTAMEMGRAGAAFQEIFGAEVTTTAAPGWMVSTASLEVQDAMGVDYASDSRGTCPFYPVFDNRRFRTLQLPTTWPTMDELIGENGVTPATVNDHYRGLIKPGLHVHTIRAELEGALFCDSFIQLLEILGEAGCRFIRLAEAAGEFGAAAPDCRLLLGEIAGRPGSVALQGTAISKGV
jgi:peptidoglycan/xylan/chitin deacetylase (PgdA/CDA1 family)